MPQLVFHQHHNLNMDQNQDGKKVGKGKKATTGLYSMNFDGSDLKLVTTNKELTKASFYFVYNDEAYFENGRVAYSDDDHTSKKINLKTGEFVSLKNDYRYQPLLYKEDKLYSIGKHGNYNDELVRITNLKNGNIALSEYFSINPKIRFFFLRINKN